MSAPTLELWQTEWCPASHRVRQRLTELGLTYIDHQVRGRAESPGTSFALPPAPATSPSSSPTARPSRGEQAILAYLNEHYVDPPDAGEQRAKAAKAKQKELEATCPKLTAATP